MFAVQTDLFQCAEDMDIGADGWIGLQGITKEIFTRFP
jgi:hypothetical protein